MGAIVFDVGQLPPKVPSLKPGCRKTAQPEAQLEYFREEQLVRSVLNAAEILSQHEMTREGGIALRTVSPVLLRQQKPARATLRALPPAVRVLDVRRRENEIERQALLGIVKESIARRE